MGRLMLMLLESPNRLKRYAQAIQLTENSTQLSTLCLLHRMGEVNTGVPAIGLRLPWRLKSRIMLVSNCRSRVAQKRILGGNGLSLLLLGFLKNASPDSREEK